MHLISNVILAKTKTKTKLVLSICRFCKIYSQTQIPESSKKKNLNSLHNGNHLHSIYKYLQSIYIVFGIISILEMI